MLYVDNGIATVPLCGKHKNKFSITLYADKRTELNLYNISKKRSNRRVHCPDMIPYVQITLKEARELVEVGKAKWINDHEVYTLRSKHIRFGMRR